MSSTNGVLDGLASGLIDQSKAGKALFILHSYAVLFIFDPVLQQQLPKSQIKQLGKTHARAHTHREVINDDDKSVLGMGRTDQKGQE